MRHCTDLQEAISLNPKDYEAYFTLGLGLHPQRKYPRASGTH